MDKAITLCFIAVLAGTPAVLGHWDACLKTQKQLWNGEMIREDIPLVTENFQKTIEVVRDTTGLGKPFHVAQTSEQQIPKITLMEKIYQFSNLNLYPLDVTKKSGALQVTFAYPTPNEPEEFLTFVVPLVEDPEKHYPNPELEWDILDLSLVRREHNHELNFHWFTPLVQDLVRMDGAPIDNGSNRNRHQVFLTNCLNIRLTVLKIFPPKKKPQTAKRPYMGVLASCVGCQLDTDSSSSSDGDK